MTASAAPQQPGRDLFLDLVAATQAGEDPAPLLHRLRAEDPVHFVKPLGFWFVTRHDDVKRLFNDPENASQDRRHWRALRGAAPEGTHAALAPGAEPDVAGRRGARALPPPLQRGVDAARGAAHGRADPRGGGALRRAAARAPGRVIDLLRRVHQPDPQHGDQPHHRRAGGRRRGALPRPRAGDDPRLLPVRAARGARRAPRPRSRRWRRGCGAWWPSAARRSREDLISDLLRAQGDDEHAQRRRDRDARLDPDRRGQRDHEPRRARDDPDAARASRAAEARARRPLARAEGRERDHALRLRRAGRHARASPCAISSCAARRSARARC